MQDASLPEGNGSTIRIKRDQPRVYTNYPASALLLGLVFVCIGVVVLLVAWKSAHDEHPGGIALVQALVGLVFLGIGLLLAVFTAKGIRLRRRARDEGGLQPWRYDHKWDSTGADDGNLRRVRSGAGTIAGMIIFLSPFHLMVLDRDSFAAALLFMPFLALFDLALLYILFRTVRLLSRWRRMGRNRVLFRQFPYHCGQPLQLTFSGSPRLANLQIKTVLHCIREYYRWSGGGEGQTATPVIESLWRTEATFATDASGSAELRFDLPADVPGTALISDLKETPSRYWELEVSAQLPQDQYEGVFLIPVYASAPLTSQWVERVNLAPAPGITGSDRRRTRAETAVHCLFFGFFILLSSLILADTVKRGVRNHHLVQNGSRANGTIIDYQRVSGKGGGSIWPVVKFRTLEGRSVVFESLYHPNYTGYAVGDNVPVVYDPKDPQSAEIDEPERLWGGMVPRSLIGALFLSVGAGGLLYTIKVGRRK